MGVRPSPTASTRWRRISRHGTLPSSFSAVGPFPRHGVCYCLAWWLSARSRSVCLPACLPVGWVATVSPGERSVQDTHVPFPFTYSRRYLAGLGGDQQSSANRPTVRSYSRNDPRRNADNASNEHTSSVEQRSPNPFGWISTGPDISPTG